jgi:hypothetical protein
MRLTRCLALPAHFDSVAEIPECEIIAAPSKYKRCFLGVDQWQYELRYRRDTVKERRSKGSVSRTWLPPGNAESRLNAYGMTARAASR